MYLLTALRTAAVAAALLGPVAMRAEDPSIKEGFKELGRGVESDSEKAWRATKDLTEKGWNATKDGTKKGWDATKDGTGKALEKTGEGLNKAGDAVEGAGEDVKD